jgi:hypothetical protein
MAAREKYFESDLLKDGVVLSKPDKDLPLKINDHIGDKWCVISIEKHTYFIRIFFKKNNNVEAVDIILKCNPSGIEKDFSSRDYTIKTVSHSSPPRELLVALIETLIKYEKTSGQILHIETVCDKRINDVIQKLIINIIPYVTLLLSIIAFVGIIIWARK